MVYLDLVVRSVWGFVGLCWVVAFVVSGYGVCCGFAFAYFGCG